MIKLEKYTLEKAPVGKPYTPELIRSYFTANVGKYSDEEYLYWDKIKYKDIPEGLNDVSELWEAVRMRRGTQKTPIKTESGEYFSLNELPFSKKLLHKLDKNAAGTFFTHFAETDKRFFLRNGLLEEAISSSQIEGAMTTSKEAREMIHKGIKPQTTDQHMIVNNFEAMNYIKNELSKKELELSDMLYLQDLLTKNTLEEPADGGRFRTDADPIIVQFENKEAHVPPKEAFLHQELARFITFANDNDADENFIHPVIKAILIHFWIGYLHPFCDGNGRTARALFYWYLLRNEYFGFSFIPISKTIKKSKTDYAKSYIYSEQDSLDVTYFINYNLRKIKQSLENFEVYVKQRFSEKRDQNTDFVHLGINERQMQLLHDFLEKPDSYTNSEAHMKVAEISKPTSVTDLQDLVKRGYLEKVRNGRRIIYRPVGNLKDLLMKK